MEAWSSFTLWRYLAESLNQFENDWNAVTDQTVRALARVAHEDEGYRRQELQAAQTLLDQRRKEAEASLTRVRQEWANFRALERRMEPTGYPYYLRRGHRPSSPRPLSLEACHRLANTVRNGVIPRKLDAALGRHGIFLHGHAFGQIAASVDACRSRVQETCRRVESQCAAANQDIASASAKKLALWKAWRSHQEETLRRELAAQYAGLQQGLRQKLAPLAGSGGLVDTSDPPMADAVVSGRIPIGTVSLPCRPEAGLLFQELWKNSLHWDGRQLRGSVWISPRSGMSVMVAGPMENAAFRHAAGTWLAEIALGALRIFPAGTLTVTVLDSLDLGQDYVFLRDLEGVPSSSLQICQQEEQSVTLLEQAFQALLVRQNTFTHPEDTVLTQPLSVLRKAPCRLLILHGLPSGLTKEQTHRLQRLLVHGRRCGVYLCILLSPQERLSLLDPVSRESILGTGGVHPLDGSLSAEGLVLRSSAGTLLARSSRDGT